MQVRSLIRRPFRYSNRNVVLWLIAVNVVIFAATYVLPSLNYVFAMNPMGVLSGRFWQVFTYMFAHANLSHLFLNMLGLFFFGTQIERELGSSEFLLFYLLTGLLAGVFSFVVYMATGSYQVFLLGASGAVYAVLLAFATIFPRAEIYIWGILPLRAPLLVIGYTLIEIGSQLFSYRSSVAHLTHLAGFGFAWLYFLARFGINPVKRFFPPR